MFIFPFFSFLFEKSDSIIVRIFHKEACNYVYFVKNIHDSFLSLFFWHKNVTPLVIPWIQDPFYEEFSREMIALWNGRVLNFGFLQGRNESSVNYDRTPSCDYISNERRGIPRGMRSLSPDGRHNNTMAKSWRRLFARRRRAPRTRRIMSLLARAHARWCSGETTSNIYYQYELTS